MIHDGTIITGDEFGLNLLTFVLRLREHPGINLNQEIDTTEDRNRFRFVRSKYVTPRPQLWCQRKWESSTCDVVFCLYWGSGMFPDMSSYAKLNRLGSHYKPSKSVMRIWTHPLYVRVYVDL